MDFRRAVRAEVRAATNPPGGEPIGSAPAFSANTGISAITRFKSLTAAGFAATAISFGPARMGFGLFVPEFRAEFELSTTAVGYISSLAFAGFFAGLLVALALLRHRGPASPVLWGLTLATAGLTTVALAPNVMALAIGVCLGASSAGFAWTPFNDAVNQAVRDGRRPKALSFISTGTGVGIAVAGFAALAMVLAGLSWRVCWAAFACAGAATLAANWMALRKVARGSARSGAQGWRALLHPDARPIYIVAFVFGVVTANYISFAADHLRERGGLPGLPQAAIPALVFIAYGLFGLFGLLTDRINRAIGLAWLLRWVMLFGAVSVALLALAPPGWFGLVSSAGLQGLHVMMTSAILAFWSERLFPKRASQGFTAALLAMAAGSVIGPALGGVLADVYGALWMFVGTAALPALVALGLRAQHARNSPVFHDDGGSDAPAAA